MAYLRMFDPHQNETKQKPGRPKEIAPSLFRIQAQRNSQMRLRFMPVQGKVSGSSAGNESQLVESRSPIHSPQLCQLWQSKRANCSAPFSASSTFSDIHDPHVAGARDLGVQEEKETSRKLGDWLRTSHRFTVTPSGKFIPGRGGLSMSMSLCQDA